MPTFHLCNRNMNIASVIEQVVTGLGFELVDIEMSPRGRLLRVFIDCTAEANRSVTVEDCATVSNQLTRVFAVEEIDYDRLEISSPGLDRPLTRPEHFARFAGQEAQLRVRVPIAGQRNFKGVIGALNDGKLSLETPSGAFAIDLDQIEKARLVPQF